jgi:hypothetical protein
VNYQRCAKSSINENSPEEDDWVHLAEQRLKAADENHEHQICEMGDFGVVAGHFSGASVQQTPSPVQLLVIGQIDIKRPGWLKFQLAGPVKNWDWMI